MSELLTVEEIRAIASRLEGWDLTDDFQMPTIEELERDLALDDRSWRSLPTSERKRRVGRAWRLTGIPVGARIGAGARRELKEEC